MTLFLGFVVLSFVTLRLPAVQRLLGQMLSLMLTNELRDADDDRTQVCVGRVDASLMLRVVLDDVCIVDRSSDTLLTATRLATRLRFTPLLSGRISLSHAQLYGSDVRLRQAADGRLNCQYLIDKLSGDGGGNGGTDLEISTILLRRGRVSLVRDVEDGQPSAEALSVRDLSATVYGLRVQDKAFSAYLRDLHLDTDYGRLDNLSARIRVSPEGGAVNALSLALAPHTELSAATQLSVDSAVWRSDFASWRLHGGRATLLAADIPAAVLGQDDREALLSHFDRADLVFAAHGSADSLTTDSLFLTAPGVRAVADATVRFSPLGVDLRSLEADYEGVEWGTLTAAGTYASRQGSLHASLSTSFADAQADASLDEAGNWRIGCLADRVRPARLASHFEQWRPLAAELGDSAWLSLRVEGSGNLRTHSVGAEGELSCSCVPVAMQLKGAVQHSVVAGSAARLSGRVDRLRPQAFGASGRLAAKTYAADLSVDAQMPATGGMESVTGRAVVGRLTVLDDSLMKGELLHGLLVDVTPTSENTRRLSVYSDFMNLHALVDGSLRGALQNVRRQLAQALPSVMGSTQVAGTAPDADAKVAMNAQLWDTRLINYLAATNLEVCDTMQLHLNSSRSLSLAVQSDSVHIGKERLSDIQLDASLGDAGLRLSASLDRAMRSGSTRLSLRAGALADSVDTHLEWRVGGKVGTDSKVGTDVAAADYGELNVRALLGDTMQIAVLPGNVVLSGTQWSVLPGRLTLMPGGVLDVDRFAIESGERHLRLDGRLSSVATDTLQATLNHVNLGYIFDLVNFHSVELNGDATGIVYATGLTTSPRADGNLLVTNFSFNDDVLGDMNLAAHWDTDEGQLDVYGDITGPSVPSATRFGSLVKNHTIISGRINPGKSNPRSGLDLSVEAGGFSLGFLNMWTGGIFEDIQGCITGNVRIFGPFNGVDLEGAVVIDHCVGRVPTLGDVKYQFGGDTVLLRPGVFELQALQLFDKHAASRRPGHSATVNGRITHRHFNHMNFDLTAETINLLGFNTREFGDDVFYGRAYLTGNVHLNGAPGRLDVDISGTTQRGSMLVYNSTTPDAVTNSNFITFVDNLDERRGGAVAVSATPALNEAAYDNSADINLHFNVLVTPETTLRVLMDQRSGDFIELQGTAPLQCSYYNKGALRMYGTYEVERGRYRMTLQDFIRKEFTFSQGGTISFPGRPVEAKLALQAVYPVSGVNLNDLAATATFSSTRTRVNCLMDLTGTALAPQVSFDFDLPNASADELQMVKSLVSTEEERNLQAVYLLGLGNFYVQDNATTSSRGNMAVNSFLSSTLSSQINSLLGDVIGNSNWQVGTNISTGQMGWNEVQAEGSLSGRLFHDRLLVNGTFGYREGTTTNQTGFIGDFDARWLLTPKGTISIKAYSQTTDRYFTKSALTTQGLGVVLQKDFSSLRDLFNFRPKTAQ